MTTPDAPTITSYVFRATWPILDDSLTFSQLRLEAAGQIDALAAAAGARITGDVHYTVAGNRLVAEAPAEPVEVPRIDGRVTWGSVSAQHELIQAMARRGLSDAQIADSLGCSVAAVAKVRARHGIPPGVGKPIKHSTDR